MVYKSILINQSISSIFIILLSTVHAKFFELDENIGTVECIECIQTWSSSNHFSSSSSKCSHPKICTGNACFMRQCKHCPVYQYMMGCVTLTRWQISDIEYARKDVDIRSQRPGPSLLCEDSFNQTTCICNRRDKCNSLHLNLPFTTYSEGLFNGIINFDSIIGKIDPNYFTIIPGHQKDRYGYSSGSLIYPINTLSLLITILLRL